MANVSDYHEKNYADRQVPVPPSPPAKNPPRDLQEALINGIRSVFSLVSVGRDDIDLSHLQDHLERDVRAGLSQPALLDPSRRDSPQGELAALDEIRASFSHISDPAERKRLDGLVTLVGESIQQDKKPPVPEEVLQRVPVWDKSCTAAEWFDLQWRPIADQYLVHRHEVMNVDKRWAKAYERHLNYAGLIFLADIFPPKEGLTRGPRPQPAH